MKVEVIMAHGNYKVGDIIPDIPALDADWRIARGLVRPVADEHELPALETAAIDRPGKRKHSRRRK